MKIKLYWLLICFPTLLLSQESVYFKNFVYHANGQACRYPAPSATFTAYLNGDQSQVLIENAPRWQMGGDPNIDGKGTFGVELGNFYQLKIGDTVSVRFTCNPTKEQAILTDVVTAIPWLRFPLILYLKPADLPAPPQNVTLSKTTNHHRLLTWQSLPGLKYQVYRRTVQDTVIGGQSRKLYHRIAEALVSDRFIDTSAVKSELYGYIIYAQNAADVLSSHSAEVSEEPLGQDLNVGWIARLPRIYYVWNSANPKAEGWPNTGDPVFWVATMKNWSDSTYVGVRYQWLLDDMPVLDGTVDLPAGQYQTVDYPWSWTFDRHRLSFVIDSDHQVPEAEEGNNKVTVFTDAITVGFYVEQSVYDYFHTYQKVLGVHSNGWEDWAQRHVRRWNDMFASAIYPDSPNGVLDRIRLDNITIVPDGRLPLAGGLATNHPNRQDRTVDLQWGFTATGLNSDFYKNHTSVSDNNPFYFEGSLLHELGHARYLIDLYGFNVHDDGTGNTIAIKENGQSIIGSEYLPAAGGAVHWTPIKGLMNGEYTWIDAYSAVAMNRIAGHRATMGNFNAPDNIGVFMQELPSENVLTVKDDAGNVLPNARVWVYQATGQAGVWYGKYYDNTPDLQLRADAKGQVLLGRCPFAADGNIEHTYGLSNAVIVLRVEHAGSVGYGFLESTVFNMEYWRGNFEQGSYELRVKMVAPSLVPPDFDPTVPDEFILEQNYPNPFNPHTTIAYGLPEFASVILEIFSVTGQKIKTLVQAPQPAGRYQVIWSGDTDTGARAASGIYFYRIRMGNVIQRKKMVFMQ